MPLPVSTKIDNVDFETMVDRIMTVFKSATQDEDREGRSWYPVAHDLAVFLAGDATTGAGVIAALSANKSWDTNTALATRAFSGDPGGTMLDALNKAERIMSGEHPEDVLPINIKTGQFYRCIVDPQDPHAVTIDRHAHDLAVGERYGSRDRGLKNINRYNIIADAYREAAQRLNELPLTVQAVTWVVWK